MSMLKKREKEKMHTQRRYATCLQRHVKKNVLIAHVGNNKGRKSHAKEFILESPEIVQILAHLDQTV